MIKNLFIALILLHCSFAVAGEIVVLHTEFQDITPKFIKNADGSYTGLSYELMKMIQRQSGVTFTFGLEPVPISRVSSDLERGIIDIQIGLQKSPEREKMMLFGEPLYAVRTIALVMEDDRTDFSSLSDLVRLGSEKGMVLTVWGTGTAEILKSVKGLYVDDGAKSVEEAIHKLMHRRGRVLIYHNLSLWHVLNRSAYTGKVKIVSLDYGGNRFLEDAFQYIVFSKKTDPALVKRINRAVVECRQSGELEKITSKYLK